MEENKIKMMLVKTNIGCFISDCFAYEGTYGWEYHKSQINELYFDGEKPEKTYYKNWYVIRKYPSVIQKLCSGKVINKRYVINDKCNITKSLPEVIPYEKCSEYNDSILQNIYSLKYDTLPDYFIDVNVDIQQLLEINDLPETVKFDYEAVHKICFENIVYHITNADINHQMLDRIIYPPVLLSQTPCKLTSKQMYDITRQFVREHINGKYAKITSDYDFCFEVKKIVQLYEPKTIAYQNVFGKTKKERSKIHYQTTASKETTIFEMTNDSENYKGYTIIKELYANNEAELKEKLDDWLNTLIEIINCPLNECPHCKGTGYMSEIKEIDGNKEIERINNKNKK